MTLWRACAWRRRCSGRCWPPWKTRTPTAPFKEALAMEAPGGEEDLRGALKLASDGLVTPLVD